MRFRKQQQQQQRQSLKTNVFKDVVLTVFWNLPKKIENILASLECKKIKDWNIGKIKVVFHVWLVLNFIAVEFLTYNKSMRPGCKNEHKVLANIKEIISIFNLSDEGRSHFA